MIPKNWNSVTAKISFFAESVLHQLRLSVEYSIFMEAGRILRPVELSRKMKNIIRFTNLSPGEYTLHIRAVSNEDKRIVLEERTMKISIAQPIWLSFWAMLVYAIVLAVIAIITLRIIILRKQRKSIGRENPFLHQHGA